MLITVFTHKLWFLIHIKAKSINLCFSLGCISVLEVKVKPFCGINVKKKKKKKKVESESEAAQSCLTLSDPMDSSYQAPPSMGFSRQQYWSGVPLKSLIYSHISFLVILWQGYFGWYRSEFFLRNLKSLF